MNFEQQLSMVLDDDLCEGIMGKAGRAALAGLAISGAAYSSPSSQPAHQPAISRPSHDQEERFVTDTLGKCAPKVVEQDQRQLRQRADKLGDVVLDCARQVMRADPTTRAGQVQRLQAAFADLWEWARIHPQQILYVLGLIFGTKIREPELTEPDDPATPQ